MIGNVTCAPLNKAELIYDEIVTIWSKYRFLWLKYYHFLTEF